MTKEEYDKQLSQLKTELRDKSQRLYALKELSTHTNKVVVDAELSVRYSTEAINDIYQKWYEQEA